MKARAARFTQADITRAIRGAAKAGVTVAVEIGLDGAIKIIPIEPQPAPPAGGDAVMELIRGAKF